MEEGRIYSLRHRGDWGESVSALLDASGEALRAALDGRERLILKPNLVEALKPPITTPVELVAELIDGFRRLMPKVEVIVAEGVGAADYETDHAFSELGYTDMAADKGVELIDLNTEEFVELSKPECLRWPVMHLPKIIMESFVVSVPVLKAHSLSSVTLTMKNMMGAVPPVHYQAGGHWKKSALHDRMQESILDLSRYRTPDFTVLDATVGMAEAHLWGPTCDPPVGRLAASFDPVAIDAYGAELLGKDWRYVAHINDAHGELGRAHPLEVVEVDL